MCVRMYVRVCACMHCVDLCAYVCTRVCAYVCACVCMFCVLCVSARVCMNVHRSMLSTHYVCACCGNTLSACHTEHGKNYTRKRGCNEVVIQR